MRYRTTQRGDAVEVIIRHLTPAWVGMVIELRKLLRPGLWGGAAFAIFFLPWHEEIDLAALAGVPSLKAGEIFVVKLALIAASVWPVSAITYGLCQFLFRIGGYASRPCRAIFSPELVGLRHRNKWIWLAREDGLIAIRLEPHRRAKQEIREQERLAPEARVAHVYRDAFEIWLQQGLELRVIAEVFEETEARAVVRTLQHFDAHAMRGHETARARDPFGNEVEV